MIDTLKLLIVDDSLVFRQIISRVVRDEPGISVIGSVRNGVLAMDLINNQHPDIVTLDVEMPEKDGIQTLKEIQGYNKAHADENPIGVIMLSAFTQKGAEVTVKALELGAFDFVTKPQSKNESESLEILQRTLLPKLINYDTLKNKWLNKRNFPDSQILSPTNIDTVQIVKSKNHNSRKIKVIAIGISTGGPKALTEMLPDLCKLTELPILIVQHMPEHFTQSLAESLTKKCSHIVKEAENDELIMDGYVYIARGNKHMLIRRNEENQPCIMLNDQPPENGCRPSVDVLFRSISNVYRGDCITIIMTGMGSDGSSSLYSLKRAGAYILAQDEPTSIVWGMPGSAVATGCVDEVVSLEDLPDKIEELIIKAESGGIRWN